jgi:hypothetical protein
VGESTSAMRSLQNFEFFSKNIKIQYAKSKSNIVKIMDGTLFYVQNPLKRSNVDTDVPSKKLKGDQEEEEEIEMDEDEDEINQELEEGL